MWSMGSFVAHLIFGKGPFWSTLHIMGWLCQSVPWANVRVLVSVIAGWVATNGSVSGPMETRGTALPLPELSSVVAVVTARTSPCGVGSTVSSSESGAATSFPPAARKPVKSFGAEDTSKGGDKWSWDMAMVFVFSVSPPRQYAASTHQILRFVLDSWMCPWLTMPGSHIFTTRLPKRQCSSCSCSTIVPLAQTVAPTWQRGSSFDRGFVIIAVVIAFWFRAKKDCETMIDQRQNKMQYLKTKTTQRRSTLIQNQAPAGHQKSANPASNTLLNNTYIGISSLTDNWQETACLGFKQQDHGWLVFSHLPRKCEFWLWFRAKCVHDFHRHFIDAQETTDPNVSKRTWNINANIQVLTLN